MKKYIYQLLTTDRRTAVVIETDEAKARIRACIYCPGGGWLDADSIKIGRASRVLICQVLALEKS